MSDKRPAGSIMLMTVRDRYSYPSALAWWGEYILRVSDLRGPPYCWGMRLRLTNPRENWFVLGERPGFEAASEVALALLYEGIPVGVALDLLQDHYAEPLIGRAALALVGHLREKEKDPKSP